MQPFNCIADEFEEVIKQTILHQKIPFDLDSEFIKLYFGQDKKRIVTYSEFSQFLHVRHSSPIAMGTGTGKWSFPFSFREKFIFLVSDFFPFPFIPVPDFPSKPIFIA